MAVCRYHRDRSGIGVCMRCRAVICAACCTKVDGVNHCHACLKALALPEAALARGFPLTAALATLGLTWLLFTGALWLVHGALAR